ncbi:uncharacterized protein LOC114530777 [Dendronephthya gigantea]|uniref:uncharacterized protein LOC114530777 n=1 Tax=Dendronephthya gigantea TaxID=151771 RepID=UPI00106D3AFB|nr:uncharacterized protein LOC114530777 [Dendronephthya gigantea]
MEELVKRIDTKRKVILSTSDTIKRAIENRNVASIERQRNTMRKAADEIYELKVQVQEIRIQKDDNEDEIQSWTKNIEQELESWDNEIAGILETTQEWKREDNKKAKSREQEIAAKERHDLFKEQLEYDKAKLEQQTQHEMKMEKLRNEQGKLQGKNAKLPKLIITKFNGTPVDWLRFWNQFEAEVDKADVAPVTKFSYLKELVDPKVKSHIDGLPFSTEGYEHAKNILKTKYGEISEIVNAYVENIMNLPTIQGTNTGKIHDFYSKLSFNVQSLETLGKLKEVNGYARLCLCKLEGIRNDLVRTDDNWRQWDFVQLADALRKWTERNPVRISDKSDKPDKHASFGRTNAYQAHQRDTKQRRCAYCNETSHASVNCTKLITSAERKKCLSEKRLCFNCTGVDHRAGECRSRAGCTKCKRRHHTSICDAPSESPPPPEPKRDRLLNTATDANKPVVYPAVIVDVNGVKCCALIDTGAGSSYASSALLDTIKAKVKKQEIWRVEMMFGIATRNVKIYDLTVNETNNKFNIKTEVTRVERNELLTLDNPRYADIIANHSHLQGINMHDNDQKERLPVHLILGTGDYSKIKTATKPRVGSPGEPVAELTKFGWTIMSPGKEIDLNNMFSTQVHREEYEKLCRLDVLGLEDSATGDQHDVYNEFKEQLSRSGEGWYETDLPWKGNHPPLPSNKTGSLKRLDNLVKKLEKQDILEKYDKIIMEQAQEGIVEVAEPEAVGKEFYLPHKAVIKESAETTKMRIVYDASARENEKAPFLNECLQTGPPLQNDLWQVLVRGRFHPVGLTGDLKQAFLQVRIRKEHRDAMRFHWFKDLKSREVVTFRFTRALFGLSPSPFLLGGVIQQHLTNYQQHHPEVVTEIKKSMYVDDLVSGGDSVEKVKRLKENAIDIFRDATFKLYKWHSNIAELESEETKPTNPEGSSKSLESSQLQGDETFAKQQFSTKPGQSAILGLAWNKDKDEIKIEFPADPASPTKRGVLGKIAKVYDPLGLISPITLQGKFLYRDCCDSKVPWDAKLPCELEARWTAWEKSLPENVAAPRSLAKFQEPIEDIRLHTFGDASIQGVGATVIAVVRQASGTTQGLVAAKSRLAKKNLTIPRLELVSAHMATNLVDNVREALEGFPVSQVFGWLDSTVALHWIRGNGELKQFVGNRVKKIQERDYIQWRHVTSRDNPADLASRGSDVSKLDKLWWNGPDWLNDEDNWPLNIKTQETTETQAETKAVKELFSLTVPVQDELDQLLKKFEFWKTIRITATAKRFMDNAKDGRENKNTGPLTTEETSEQVKFWVKKIQARNEGTAKFEEDREQLNLQQNEAGVYECQGRIQGHFPIYLPDNELLTEKIVEHAHKLSCHGGVGMTMAKFREKYWTPRLRNIVKRVTKSCHTCKRFRAIAVANPPIGNLPRDRTEGNTAFQVVGVDYAGPIKYLKKSKREGKAYIILYACSLTRATYLELLPNQETSEFVRSLKRLVARRGRPQRIYSDNAKTFAAAAKWLRNIMKDERLHDWLSKFEIRWQFNTSRAPWWGGQYERIIGLVKQALYKTGGGTLLTWNALQDHLLDIQVSLNNRPLSYVEDDIQLPLLTPNTLMHNRPNNIPTQDYHEVEERDLRKTAKRLEKCKDKLWRRWTDEYLKGLRERHNLRHNNKQFTLKVGEVVIIKSDERDRNKWKLGIVENLIRDGVVRVAKLRAGKGHLERAVQHLYPLELSCDIFKPEKKGPILRPEAEVFRPKRDAAVAAELRIQDTVANEDQ